MRARMPHCLPALNCHNVGRWLVLTRCCCPARLASDRARAVHLLELRVQGLEPSSLELLSILSALWLYRLCASRVRTCRAWVLLVHRSAGRLVYQRTSAGALARSVSP